MTGPRRHDNTFGGSALDGSAEITTGGGVLGEPSGDDGSVVEPVAEGSDDCEMTTGPVGVAVGVGVGGDVGVGSGLDGRGDVGPATGPDVAPADVSPEFWFGPTGPPVSAPAVSEDEAWMSIGGAADVGAPDGEPAMLGAGPPPDVTDVPDPPAPIPEA